MTTRPASIGPRPVVDIRCDQCGCHVGTLRIELPTAGRWARLPPRDPAPALPPAWRPRHATDMPPHWTITAHRAWAWFDAPSLPVLWLCPRCRCTVGAPAETVRDRLDHLLDMWWTDPAAGKRPLPPPALPLPRWQSGCATPSTRTPRHGGRAPRPGPDDYPPELLELLADDDPGEAP